MTDMFTEKAKDWDVNEMVRALSSAVGSAILENVELNDRMHVMDFGAGTGLITSRVCPLVKRITAVDTSEAMLKKLTAKEEFNGKVDALCRDIADQPIDTRFDLIMSAMAMHHVEDTNNIVRRFAEHLKPAAKVALADLDKEDGSFHPEGAEGVFHAGFDRHEFQAILEEHGFKDIHFVTAHTIEKENGSYPVFLAIATKG